MGITAIPALLLALILGRVWASVYNLEGPKRQPGALFGGLVLVTILAAAIVIILAGLADTHLEAQVRERWGWLIGSMKWMLIPQTVLFSYVMCRMYLRRMESKHRVRLARIRAARQVSRELDLSDAPIERGASTLG